MFGIGIDELILILIVLLIFIKPNGWLNIIRYTGKLIGRYKTEMRKINNIINENYINDNDIKNAEDADAKKEK